MRIPYRWQREPGIRLAPSHDLDRDKLQGPCVVSRPDGGFRLFYTAVGPGKPFANCQGYILSAISEDGVNFEKEPGFRLMPQPDIAHMSLRVLVPSVVSVDNGWRMYFESRGPADRPFVICSAFSNDQLTWELEDGIRFQATGSTGGPRYLQLPDGRGRMYCCGATPEDPETGGVVSAITTDGLNFDMEPGYRIRNNQHDYDSVGCTAAQVIATGGGDWSMVFSTWQDAPPGADVPPHPSSELAADGSSEDFAAASIASDMAGYRSRIFMAYSMDGLVWEHGECAVAGAGYGGDGPDAVHAEDMSVIRLEDGRYRMYYAACDNDGIWSVASAVTT